MGKRYTEYLDEITAQELYEGLLAYGFFSEKLPPIFTAEEFYKYSFNLPQAFSKFDHDYVFFESMRDINVPRALGIPNPMAYQKLCASLSDNWQNLQAHFHKQTDTDTYKISRIHIRKRKGTKSLFKMNYQNWHIDDSPIPDILIGKKYVVHADVSTCFPSIYSHSLCWALVGKPYSKANRDESLWFNDIDHKCMELKSGETHGLLIGPHASNLLSEVILSVVDHNLGARWEYIRNIDDYTCYVDSYEAAQQFLVELASELHQFDLTLNHKKTKIEELPIAATTQWVRQINAFDFATPYCKIDYKKAQAYLDLAINLMAENENNAAILNYAIKVLSQKELTTNARKYCLKTILHLAVIYPYLMPILDEYVFVPFGAEQKTISDFSQLVYTKALEQNNFEAAIYTIYYSLKYSFDITALKYNDAISKGNCLVKLFTWLYFLQRDDQKAIKELKKHAKSFTDEEFDRNWIFAYEVLSAGQLSGEWKPMKKAGISFIKTEYRSKK